MDITTIGGILLAIFAILGGQALEGGHASSILQATAALIVLGGTLGATLVSYPLKEFLRGVKAAKAALTDKKVDLGALTAQIVELAGLARRDGVLALEGKIAELDDPFLKRALGFVVDGLDPSVTRDTLEAEIDHEFEEGVVGAKVFETAGGYAPTIGIIGAVLGLIHVMENLNDPSKLGGGIATAFVATVYGVGVANLVLLPVANKLKRKLTVEKERKTVISEGVLAIQEGLNPRVLEEKLRALTGGHAAPLPLRPPRQPERSLAMARKKKHEEEHENHERWLVSYADFITLLFAFFVVLYSISRVDNKKLSQTQTAIRWAMHFSGTGGSGAPPVFEGPPSSEGGCIGNLGTGSANTKVVQQAIEAMAKKVEKKLKPFLIERQRDKTQSVTIDVEGRRLTVRLAASRFFEPGQAALVPDALLVLDAVAEELSHLGRPIRVEGHTDDGATGGGRYRTNWELSAARAATVTSYLDEAHHVPIDKLSAVGYGSTRPLVPNDTPEHRELNRRIAFVLEIQPNDPLVLALPSGP